MIGVLVAAFLLLSLVTLVCLTAVAGLRSRMSFESYRRSVQVLTFVFYFGLWGAIVGGAFWIAS